MRRFSSQILIKMNEKKYDLDFYQALEVVMNGGAVKGDNFVDGIFLKLNSRGQLVIVDAGRLNIEEIKQVSNIVDVVSTYLPLKKSGANYTCTCPFPVTISLEWWKT